MHFNNGIEFMGYIYFLHLEEKKSRVSIGLFDFVMEIVRILLCMLSVYACVHLLYSTWLFISLSMYGH